MGPEMQDGLVVRQTQILSGACCYIQVFRLILSRSIAEDVSPPVPVADLFRLVDFSLVRWDLVGLILPTWLGMVLVVAFASSLDVAAISMDMGEALETNKELITVGIGNLLSGLTLGYTGYVFF